MPPTHSTALMRHRGHSCERNKAQNSNRRATGFNTCSKNQAHGLKSQPTQSLCSQTHSQQHTDMEHRQQDWRTRPRRSSTTTTTASRDHVSVQLGMAPAVNGTVPRYGDDDQKQQSQVKRIASHGKARVIGKQTSILRQLIESFVAAIV